MKVGAFLNCIGLPVSQRDQFVENPHNDIVVVAILSVLKHYTRVVKEIVGNDFHVVDLLDDSIKSSVGIKILAERILLGQVGHYLLFHDIIQLTEDAGTDIMFLCEGTNIL